MRGLIPSGIVVCDRVLPPHFVWLIVPLPGDQFDQVLSPRHTRFSLFVRPYLFSPFDWVNQICCEHKCVVSSYFYHNAEILAVCFGIAE